MYYVPQRPADLPISPYTKAKLTNHCTLNKCMNELVQNFARRFIQHVGFALSAGD